MCRNFSPQPSALSPQPSALSIQHITNKIRNRIHLTIFIFITIFSVIPVSASAATNSPKVKIYSSAYAVDPSQFVLVDTVNESICPQLFGYFPNSYASWFSPWWHAELGSGIVVSSAPGGHLSCLGWMRYTSIMPGQNFKADDHPISANHSLSCEGIEYPRDVGGSRAYLQTLSTVAYCECPQFPEWSWDGKMCVKDAVTNKPQLSLTPAPNQKDPRPLKAEGKDGKSTYELIAKVTENGSPKAGVAVTFAVEPIANSGGHDHHDASRPKGKVTANNPVTDANGQVIVTFQASQIAGTHVVAAVCNSCTNTSVTKNVDVKVPDLVPFLALPFRSQLWNSEGIGQTVEHLDNHYLTVAATYRLLEIAAKYKKIWPTAPKLTLNDASLKWGGKFDISGTWDRSKDRHAEHRIGDNIDIRANGNLGSVPDNIKEKVFDWLQDDSEEEDAIPLELRIRSVNPLWENPGKVNEHFHLRLGN